MLCDELYFMGSTIDHIEISWVHWWGFTVRLDISLSLFYNKLTKYVQ